MIPDSQTNFLYLADSLEKKYPNFYKQFETVYDIDIPLDIIKRITINQQMSETIYETIKEYLKNLNGKPNSRINRSTLYENKRWINRFKK